MRTRDLQVRGMNSTIDENSSIDIWMTDRGEDSRLPKIREWS